MNEYLEYESKLRGHIGGSVFGLVLIVLAIWAVVAFLLKDDSEGIDAVGIESQAKGENELLSSSKGEEVDDKFVEIKKYKELLDMGIITQEEFEVKRKEILK